MPPKTTTATTQEPVKFLKPGKVVILLQGRYAGKKAIIVNNYDKGTKERPYAHAIVAGIQKHPSKVTKGMSKQKLYMRTRMRSFVKIVNYTHILPTRYGVDVDLKKTIDSKLLKKGTSEVDDPTAKKEMQKKVNEVLQKRFMAGKNTWFFSKLRF